MKAGSEICCAQSMQTSLAYSKTKFLPVKQRRNKMFVGSLDQNHQIQKIITSDFLLLIHHFLRKYLSVRSKKQSFYILIRVLDDNIANACNFSIQNKCFSSLLTSSLPKLPDNLNIFLSDKGILK